MPMDCFPRDLVPVINILAQISLPWHRKTDDLSRRLFLSHLGWSHRNDFSEGHGREVLNLRQFSSVGSCRPWEEALAGSGHQVMAGGPQMLTPHCAAHRWGAPSLQRTGSQGACPCWRIPESMARWATKQTPDYWLEFFSCITSSLQPWDPGLDEVKTPKTYGFLWRKIFFPFPEPQLTTSVCIPHHFIKEAFT